MRRPQSSATASAMLRKLPHTLALLLATSCPTSADTHTLVRAATDSPAADSTGNTNNSNSTTLPLPPTTTNASPAQQQNWMLLAVISVAVLFVVVLAMISFMLLRRRRKLQATEALELELESTSNASKATQFIHGHTDLSTRTHGSTGLLTTATTATMDMEYLPNDIRLDEDMQSYRLQQREVVCGRLLATGGFGAIYKALFRNETVVVKQLRPDKRRNRKLLESFMDEIRLCAALDHPKIVRFIGVTWSSLADLSVVLEFVPNGDLGTFLTKELERQQHTTSSNSIETFDWFKSKHLPNSDTLQRCPTTKALIALDIAEALVYLHSFWSPIIHRDLKSTNILLSAAFEAKLTDFGVSRELDEDQTMTGEIGTVAWIAPEVLRGERYTEKADIYSFGVILTELDTCRRPYTDGFSTENGQGSSQHTNTRIAVLVSAGQLQPAISAACPSNVRQVIQQCLDVDPLKRPSAVQLHFDLRTLESANENETEAKEAVDDGKKREVIARQNSRNSRSRRSGSSSESQSSQTQ